MPSDNLVTVLREEAGGLPADFDSDSLDRILTEPQQNQLAEAIAADAVDASPLVGDIFALVRIRRAEERGMEYPNRPAFIESIVGDLPEPLDTVGDVIFSQNVLQYLQQNYDVAFPAQQAELVDQQAESVDDAIDLLLSDTLGSS
jgi:hypothetical protein